MRGLNSLKLTVSNNWQRFLDQIGLPQCDSPVFLGIKRIFPKPVRPRTNFIQQQRYFYLRSQYILHVFTVFLTALIAASNSYMTFSKQMTLQARSQTLPESSILPF